MKILVTGGAGFIGGNFVHFMLKEHPQDDILCVDALTYAGNMETLAPVMDNPHFKFIKADIADREAIYNIFEQEKPEIVVNFAAESHVDRSIENPSIFLQTNVMGTQVLLDACRKYGIQRYHQVSTDEVYGDLPLDRPDLFFTEETPIHTSSPYSASKASADLLVQAYHRTFGVPVTISRCSNNYGPYHFPEKLIPLMIANVLNDKPLPVYGDGKNVRDWLYVEDHCRAIDLIIHNGRVGEVYNVGGHNEKTNLEVVQLIIAALGKGEIKFVRDRAGHDRRYAIDPTKIHNELGWLPQTKFEDGIQKTIQWYLDNKSWWENIISGDIRSIMNECMEIDNPLITIVMAVYEPNMQWLKEQLLSLEAQTYPNLELIIRDDCSPTVPFEQICECAATCIRSFPYEISRNERNVGSNQTLSG